MFVVMHIGHVGQDNSKHILNIIIRRGREYVGLKGAATPVEF